MSTAWDPLAVRVSQSDVPRGSSATFYKYKSKYGGMEPSDAKRLRALEDENGKLKQQLAELMLDNAMLRDINSKKW
jgi:putative transposase